MQDSTAALVVVLPIPISPMPRMSYPAATAVRLISIPAANARSASSSVMAGPSEMSQVPGRIRRSMILCESQSGAGSCAPPDAGSCLASSPPKFLSYSSSGIGSFTPMSTIMSSLPKLFDKAPTPVRRRVKFIVCARVTLCGAEVTP